MPRICIKASLNPYLYTAYCVSHGWLLLMHNTVDTWHKEVTAQIAKYKKREKIVRVEGGQEIQARWNNRKCPKFSALLIRLKYHFFCGGDAWPYRSEISVNIRVLADVLMGHISPLQKVLISFVLWWGVQKYHFMDIPAEIHDKKKFLSVHYFNDKVQTKRPEFNLDVNIIQTFLSSTTTSVLCLLIVCGRDNLLTSYNKEL